MRIIATLLVIYTSLLTVSPSVCGVYSALNKAVQLETNSCSNKQTPTNSKNAKNCSPCCSTQNCNCYFVDVLHIDAIASVEISNKKHPFKNDKYFSSYLSDCWHPPEKI